MKMNKLILCALALLIFAACARGYDFADGDAEYFHRFSQSFDSARATTWGIHPVEEDESWDGAVFGMQNQSVMLTDEAVTLQRGMRTVSPAPMAPPVVDAPAETAPGAAISHGAIEWEEIAETGVRHIIQNATVEMATEDFDRAVTELRLVGTSGDDGYIESEMLTNHGRRMFSIVLRVPAARFEEVLEQVQTIAEVRMINSQAQDVTDQFYDLAGNLETRRIEEERILALIDEAENIHDLLALETRLSNTRQSIERYISRLNTMAGQIAFSTIAVTLFDIYEVEEPEPATFTFTERMGGAFGDSVDGTVQTVQNVIVFLAGAFFPIVFFAVLAALIFIFVRLIRKRITG